MLAKYRNRKGISQEKLANKLDIDKKTIFRIENDLNLPTLDTFAKIVTALELTDKEIAKEVKKSIEIKKHSKK